MDLFVLATGLIFTIAACFIGMKPDPGLSQLTKVVKKYSYPIWVLAVIAMGILNFTRWN